MQTVGILLLSVGIWVVYCGLYGIPPLETARAIIVDPSNARTLIADARAKANEKYKDLIATAVSYTGTATGNGAANPWAVFPVSDDWDAHIKRGSLGGTDYIMPVGTPVVTPKAGVVTNMPNNGSGGNVTRVKFDDGYTIELMHLSKFLKASGDRVSAFTPVGLSGGAKGAEGAGSSTGPHLHVDILTPTGSKMEFAKYASGGTVSNA